MALMAAHGDIEPMPDCAIFADTQAEPKRVYEWLDWLEEQLPFPVYRVTRGNLRADIKESFRRKRFASVPFFTESENSNGGVLRRQCTREYKIEPITKKVRELLGYEPRQRIPSGLVTQWIGISLDEIQRMKPGRNKWIELRWPLIERRLSLWDCLAWMEKQGFPLPAKSSCTFCPFHNDVFWREMKLYDPESWADAVDIDRTIRNGLRGTTQKLYVHRGLKPLEETDFSNLEDCGQLNFFNEECEGMCGV